MIVLTLGANIKIACTDPVLGIIAFFTDELYPNPIDFRLHVSSVKCKIRSTGQDILN